MVIDREREMEKERKFSHSTYKFDQQKKSAIAAAEDDDDACSLSLSALPLMDPVVKSGHCPNQRSARYGNSAMGNRTARRERPRSRGTVV